MKITPVIQGGVDENYSGYTRRSGGKLLRLYKEEWRKKNILKRQAGRLCSIKGGEGGVL